MNWLSVIVLVVLIISLLVFVNSRKEHFENPWDKGAMYEQKLFGDNQYLYNRDIVDKQIPLNAGVDISKNFNAAASQPDVDLQSSPDRDFSNFFGVDPTAKYRALDANCKSITRPIDLPRSDKPVQCGWWYISEPTIASIPAIGTPDQPMFTDSLPKNGQWIWDVNKAQMLEEMKNCNRVKACSTIGLDAFNGVCGWCDHKGYSVPILNGAEKFPNATFACGETVTVDSNVCNPIKPPTISASDGTLCGLYGTPSPDNSRRVYTKDECDSLRGKFTSNGDCLSSSGLVLNDECRALNKPLSLTMPIVKAAPKTTAVVSKTVVGDGMPLPLSQLGLFGGAVTMTDESQYLPGLQNVDDICTLNQYGKLPIACIQGLAVSLGYSDSGSILRLLKNPGVSFTANEEMAMNILISDGLVFPSGGILNSTDKKSVGNFLNELFGKMLSGSSGLVKAAASIFVNGDSSLFDPCNPNNPPITMNGSVQSLSTSVWCLQRAFRQAGCQATGNAYPTQNNIGTYSSQTYATIQQMFAAMFNNMSAANQAVQDQAVKNCLGVSYSRDSSVPLEYSTTLNATVGEESIACYAQSADFCAKKCSEDPTCLSYTYDSNGSQCCINATRTNIIEKRGSTLMSKNSGYPQPENPKYVGCYKDTPQHLLSVKGPGIKNGDLQPCIEFGKANQLEVMGLQNGSECYFGTATDPFTSLGAGNSSECGRYGGKATNQVYSIPLPAPVIASSPQGPEMQYKGCFKDCQGGRALPNLRSLNMTSGNNLEECADLTTKAGDNVFGLQYDHECWSGKNIEYDLQGSAGDCPATGGGCTQQVYTLPGYTKPVPFTGQPFNPSLTQNHKIGAITGATKNFILSFDITPRGTNGNWSNIMRFTLTDNNDCCNPGSRNPAIWFHPGGTGLHIRIGDVSNGNWGIDTAGLPMNQTTRVVIACIGDSVKVDVQNVGSYTVSQPNDRVDPAGRLLVVYATDPFWPPANATVANLSYQIMAPSPVVNVGDTLTVAGKKATYKGCFNDSGNRAIPQRYGTNDLETCAKQALANGNNVIGLQNGTECWGGKDSKYEAQGSAGNCPKGGRGWTNQVYTFPGYGETPPPPPSTMVKTHVGKVIGGYDIGCPRPISLPNLLQTCVNDQNCKSVSYVNNEGWGCYKTVAPPTGLQDWGACDTYTKTTSGAQSASSAWSGGVDSGNYVFFQGLDSGGNDIGNQTPQNVPALIAACNSNPTCKGFNTNGWIKHTIKPQAEWGRWSSDPSQGSYFKK